MPKIKPVTAKNPEELAAQISLSPAAVKEWQVQHVLLKRLKAIVAREKITHAEIARRAGTSRSTITAILNDDLARLKRSPDPHTGVAGLPREGRGGEGKDRRVNRGRAQGLARIQRWKPAWGE